MWYERTRNATLLAVLLAYTANLNFVVMGEDTMCTPGHLACNVTAVRSEHLYANFKTIFSSIICLLGVICK